VRFLYYTNSDTTSVIIANLLLHYCISSDTNNTFLRGPRRSCVAGVAIAAVNNSARA